MDPLSAFARRHRGGVDLEVVDAGYVNLAVPAKYWLGDCAVGTADLVLTVLCLCPVSRRSMITSMEQ